MVPIRGGRVAIYARVSTQLQAQDGHGLGAQHERLLEFAAEHRLEVVTVIADEGLSGKSLDRPGVQQVIDLARDGAINAVVVTRADRISRNVRDLLNLTAELEAAGVSIVAADEPFETASPAGKALHTVRAAFAQMEADLASVRTKEALAAAKAKGVRLGPPPLGWRKIGGEFVATERFALVERVYELNRRDGMPLSKIADVLNAEGVPTGSGRGRWQKGNVGRVVKARELAVAWCPLPEWATAAA